jgi:hypothetical protein
MFSKSIGALNASNNSLEAFPKTPCLGTASDFKRKIIAVLDQVFPEYATIFTKQGVFGKASKVARCTY